MNKLGMNATSQNSNSSTPQHSNQDPKTAHRDQRLPKNPSSGAERVPASGHHHHHKNHSVDTNLQGTPLINPWV